MYEYMKLFSIEKNTKTTNELEELTNPQKTRTLTMANQTIAKSSDYVQLEQGVFAYDYKRLFSLDGSLKIKHDPSLGKFAEFYKKEGRYARKGDDFILRGSRYIVSIDPILVVSQKLNVLQKDFTDALDVITKVSFEESQEIFIEYSGILDYIKNSVLTVLNALLQEEKLGKFKLDNQEYQKIRTELIELARNATYAFYAHLLGETGVRDAALSRIVGSYEKMHSACEYILDEYRAGIFSAKYFTRPEASHPMVILATTYTALKTIENPPDTIVGLPSGGTELAFVQVLAYQHVLNIKVNTVLVPLSFHSIKDAFGTSEVNDQAFSDYLDSIAENIKGKHVLIVDDNSSTGRTIQKMVDLLKSSGADNVEVAVSEADIIRSSIDLKDPKRTHIAAQELYKRSVSILPVLKTIMPKLDMKETLERERLVKFHREKKFSHAEEVKEFMEKVFAKITSDPTEERLDNLNDKNSISIFRGTFLSNFYACDVTYNDKGYSSVEHAYQAQKFTDIEFKKVKSETLKEIHEILKARGIIKIYGNVEEIFNDPNIGSGNIKLIADILRKSGHVRPGWDDMRVEVMADLLLQKFKDPDLLQRLQATGSKYLVEENTWGDTLWGVSGGRGRNMLGQMLMVIRDK